LSGLGLPAGRPLFTVAGRTYAWEDVLIGAELRGELAVLEQQTRLGLACLRRLATEPEALPAETLRAAAATFRHEHNLLAADELDAWLAARDLTVADWNAYLRRLLLRELWAPELDRIESVLMVGDEEVEAALPAEAACTGFLRRAAERLAEDAALIAEADAVEDAGDRAAFIAALTREAEAVRTRAPSPADVEREVEARTLDWIRIDAVALELADAEAAREAALCVRVDGRTLTDVSGDSGVPADELVLYLEDVEPGLRTPLVSARPGELIGPFERPVGQLLLELRSKTAPSTADPELVRRASAVLAARAVERELRDRVVWHERP
jgi:hypothetical protein